MQSVIDSFPALPFHSAVASFFQDDWGEVRRTNSEKATRQATLLTGDIQANSIKIVSANGFSEMFGGKFSFKNPLQSIMQLAWSNNLSQALHPQTDMH